MTEPGQMLSDERIRPWLFFGGGSWWKYIKPEPPCWKGEIHLLGLIFGWEAIRGQRGEEEKP